MKIGWAMSQYLPTGGFKWMDEEKSIQEWQNFIINQENEQDKGYYLKVDLEYPSNLHDSHDTFPCAPEHMKIEKELLSDYQKELGDELGVKYGGKKSRKAEICHIRFFIYQNPCVWGGVQVKKSKSESPHPKVHVQKSKSESPSPKVQVRKSKSESPSPKVQVRKSKSESKSPKVQV